MRFVTHTHVKYISKTLSVSFVKLFPLIVPSWQLRVPDFHDSNLIYCLENRADVTSAFFIFPLKWTRVPGLYKNKRFQTKAIPVLTSEAPGERWWCRFEVETGGVSCSCARGVSHRRYIHFLIKPVIKL